MPILKCSMCTYKPETLQKVYCFHPKIGRRCQRIGARNERSGLPPALVRYQYMLSYVLKEDSWLLKNQLTSCIRNLTDATWHTSPHHFSLFLLFNNSRMFQFFLVSSDLINDRHLIDQSLKRFSSFLAHNTPYLLFIY